MINTNSLKKIGLVAVFAMLIALSGCYKKDLEEFKKINAVVYNAEWAIPFVETKITLNDSVPTVPGFTVIRMSDTSDVQIPASDSKDTLESIVSKVTMKIKLENTFPLNGFVQVYFRDSSNVVVDSLLNSSQRIITMGSPTQVKYITVTVDKARYIDISKKSDKMYVFYDLTANASDINSITNKYLKINIGIDAKLSISLIK